MNPPEESEIVVQIDPECCLPYACDMRCGDCNILPLCLECEQYLEETKHK